MVAWCGVMNTLTITFDRYDEMWCAVKCGVVPWGTVISRVVKGGAVSKRKFKRLDLLHLS